MWDFKIDLFFVLQRIWEAWKNVVVAIIWQWNGFGGGFDLTFYSI